MLFQKIYYILCLLAAFMLGMSKVLIQYITKAILKDYTVEKKLILRFPYNVSFSPFYEIHTILLYLTWLIVVHTGGPIDCQFLVYSINMKEHFISLQEKIKSNNFESVKSLVIRHNELYNLVQKIHEAFNLSVCVQCIISAGNICTIAFQIFADNAIQTKITYIVYLISSLFELFIFCYACQEVVNGSENIATAIKECSWYNLSLAEQRSLLKMLTRSQKDIETKFIFFNVNHQFFFGVSL